jgi:hypothetical protein
MQPVERPRCSRWPPHASLSSALIPVIVAVSRHLARTAGQRGVVRLGVATFSLSFLLLVGASAHAQTPPPAPPEASRPASGIAYSFVNWLRHAAGIAPRHRQQSTPPLPRPRPTDLAATSDAPNTNKAPAELAPAPNALNKAPLAGAPNEAPAAELAPAPVAPNAKLAPASDASNKASAPDPLND